MTKRYGINTLEVYVKTKCNYDHVDALYIIEISALLLLISKKDIICILTIIGFDHKFINVIILV